jgi:anti-anti-sigma factor
LGNVLRQSEDSHARDNDYRCCRHDEQPPWRSDDHSDGAIDAAVAPQLEAGFDRLGVLGCRRLVLDLAGVPFVDAAGWTALSHAAKHARREGDEVVLRHANYRLHRLLELALLAPAFGIESSVDQVA